ncbi:hypothetical protein ACFWWT_15030 [Streptomyces sp. NPDC058676]|uniref:hypothetical protein n=1 Tax=unclassified Streptomyces TaxID=2593676 RepID=UPI0036613BA2
MELPPEHADLPTDLPPEDAQPLAEVGLFLRDDVRSWEQQSSGAAVGNIVFHGWQVRPLPTPPDLPGRDVYLVKARYDVDFDPEVPGPQWAEAGFSFDAGDLIVNAALPTGVARPEPARTYVLTHDLEFALPDADGRGGTGGPGSGGGRVGSGDGDGGLARVPLSALTPDITVFGVGGRACRWRHRAVDGGEVRLGSHVGWFVLLVPAGCEEVHVTAKAGYRLTEEAAMGMQPHAGTDEFTVRLPMPEASDSSEASSPGAARTRGHGNDSPPKPTEMRMGFGVDVVGYSDRDALSRGTLQTRLDRLVRDVLGDIGFDLEDLEHQRSGDGMNVVLPLDTDITQTLPGLVNAMRSRLRQDNERHDDRMRLRMACDAGTFKTGANGYEGEAVLSFCRLLDSSPLRDALQAQKSAELGLLISQFLYRQVVTPGYPGLSQEQFTRVTAVVKHYQAVAWLYTSPSAGSVE